MKTKKFLENDTKENFIFKQAGYFNENNLAIVQKNNWFGELNTEGRLVKKFICDNLRRTDNHYIISLNKKYAIIDLQGNFVTKPIYDEIWPFDESKNLWKVTLNNKDGILDSSNNTMLINFKYDMIYWYCERSNLLIVVKNNKKSLIDLNENVLIPAIYDDLCFYEDTLSYLYVTNYDKSGDKRGIINLNNEIIIPIEYNYISQLGKKTFAIRKGDNNYVIVNDKNEIICDKTFQDIGIEYFANKLYPAKFNNLYGFIDEFGNVKIDFKYIDARGFLFGKKYCSVSDKTYEDTKSVDIYGLIDENDNLILPCDYEECSFRIISEDRIIASKKKKDGIVDNKNNTIIDFKYYYIEDINPEKTNYHNAIINGKSGFIDVRNGDILKIDKESLKIPAIQLNLELLSRR